MLTFLAAVVPIVGSLYAGISYVLELVGRRNVARIYARIDAWYKPQREALGVALADPATRRGVDQKISDLNARKAMLLTANGVDPTLGTIKRMNGLASPPDVPAVELRRQWVLLLSAAAGVVLLAADMASS